MAPGLMIAAGTDGAKSTESLGAWTTMNTHVWRCLETSDALDMTQMGSVRTPSWMRCGSVADFGSGGGRGKASLARFAPWPHRRHVIICRQMSNVTVP